MMDATRFTALEQAVFQQLEHAGYLKGLLKPFKGKGELENWAIQCEGLRDELISLGARLILPQLGRPPFCLLSVQLAQQKTGAGTTFLRWRSLDRMRMGVVIWEELMASASPATPLQLANDLFAIEQQRIILNMQISLLHTLSRQAKECASKMARAEAIHQRCICTINPKESST